MELATPLTPAALVEHTEFRRAKVAAQLDARRRVDHGQFFTPAPVASLLASMFTRPSEPVSVLDAGAGVGSLTAALVARAAREGWPGPITTTVFELDANLTEPLGATVEECARLPGLTVHADLHFEDFIAWACDSLREGLFASPAPSFDFAILNPPYRKIASCSQERALLSKIGIEATNLYAAFLALAVRLLAPGGQMVAITPRSFCNGPYF